MISLMAGSAVVFSQPNANHAINRDSLTTPASAEAFLAGHTPDQKRLAFRRHLFINESLQQLTAGDSSTLSFILKTQEPDLFSLSNEDLQELHQSGRDQWSRELMHRYIDIPPVLPLTGIFSGLRDAIKSLTRPKHTRLRAIPTETEIDILKILWSDGILTGSALYAQLDSTLPVTAEDVQAVLADMTDKGLLHRQRISPLHTFSLFGVAEIPVGPGPWRNEKNRIYLYWPTVTRDKLITYLESRRYLAFASTRDFGDIHAPTKHIEERLHRLLR